MMFAPLSAKTVSELLKRGADPNAKDTKGMTPLMHQCSTRLVDREALQVLIDGGARKEARDTRGRTALLIAAQYLNVRSFFTLVNLGCRVSVKDKQGRNAYEYARKAGNRDLDFRIKEMLARG